nr:hypothetical protein [Desulfitobacterium hafniense]
MFSLRNSDLRRIKEEDLELILAWRNSGHVRTNMFNSQIISWQEHIAWFDKLKQRMDQTVLIYSYKDTPLGVVNFTKIDRKNGRCDWGFYIGCTQAPSGSGTAMGLLGLDYR